LPCTTTGSGIARRGALARSPPTRLWNPNSRCEPLGGNHSEENAHHQRSCSGNQQRVCRTQLVGTRGASQTPKTALPLPGTTLQHRLSPSLSFDLFSQHRGLQTNASRKQASPRLSFFISSIPLIACASFLLERKRETARRARAEQTRDLPRSTTAPASSFCRWGPSFGSV
jgi:hypothetical protein